LVGSDISCFDFEYGRGSNENCTIELRPGFVQEFSIIQLSIFQNITLSNTSIGAWGVECSGEGKNNSIFLANSLIEQVVIDTWVGITPVNSSLTGGYIEKKELYAGINLTISNSTINGWELRIYGGTVEILNSSGISCDLIANSEKPIELYTENSKIDLIYLSAYYPSFSARLWLSNSSVNMFYFSSHPFNPIELADLDEGDVTYSNLTSYAMGNINVTLLDVTIAHWGAYIKPRMDGQQVVIRNCTLAGARTHDAFYIGDYDWVGLTVMGPTAICDSYVKDLVAGGVPLFINSSVVESLQGYGGAITAFDSRIDMIIEDPLNIELTNCTRTFGIDVPFPMWDFGSDQGGETMLRARVADQPSVPLPSSINQMSKLLNVSSVYPDVFEVRVRLYYNKDELHEMGVDQNSLSIINLMTMIAGDYVACKA